MNRIPVVAGNWKMNKTVAEARDLVSIIRGKLHEIPNVEKVLCPPYLAIPALADMLQGAEIGLGAQNLYWEEKGAFTGEVSPGMVKEFCKYVILGHSERRTYFGETDETVSRKVSAAVKTGLTPIVCVGETLEQYEAGLTSEVVRRQIKVGLAAIDPVDPANSRRIIVAYEPVWAIGTGKTATNDDIRMMHGFIRRMLGKAVDQPYQVTILYGGSVKAANAAEILAIWMPFGPGIFASTMPTPRSNVRAIVSM